MDIASFLGVAASIGGVSLGLAPLLQIRLIMRRRSSEGISISFWIIQATGLSLWLAYGIAIGNPAIIVANAVSITTTVTVIVLAGIYQPKPWGDSDPPGHGWPQPNSAMTPAASQTASRAGARPLDDGVVADRL